jgi:hypothetical protein
MKSVRRPSFAELPYPTVTTRPKILLDFRHQEAPLATIPGLLPTTNPAFP